ncbi:MAG: bifunctional tetrahydrofolate synthase/dihydrofolate synthase [Coxiella sp. (in: Bacteria)]|nr:MAG: bifunctional tetrahydrofolate synthase/dihydrofolate synthase [Coxiella sp. (in: g-proteobacteria)]
MTFDDYLLHITTLSAKPIDLSLTRVQHVANLMNLLELNHCPVITVGGTNGKGSTVAMLEAIYRQANFKTAVFTSPHIHCPTELFRINGTNVSKEQLCAALAAVEQARQSTLLTEYEFYMLAALWLFKQSAPDIVILEVGLGGRGDVTNIIDPSLAIITNVALDHCQWLGNDREAIGAIKSGIFRDGIPIVIGERHPPQSVLKRAPQAYRLGRDFDFASTDSGWRWHCADINLPNLPRSQLIMDNAATALMAVACLHPDFLKQPLPHPVTVPGRFQLIHTPCLQIHDAAHNPAAAHMLAKQLTHFNHPGKIKAVFSMYADKDIDATVNALEGHIDQWYVAPLNHQRGATLPQLETALSKQTYLTFNSITTAYDNAIAQRHETDLLLAFGSFQVLSELL